MFLFILLRISLCLYFRKPKTHRGKRMLAKREPKIIELSKKALMLRGATASATSLQFVKDLVVCVTFYIFIDS